MDRASVLLVVGVLVLLVPAPASAVPGEKAPACPKWASKLAALEQAGEDPASVRLRKLRSRIANHCVALNEIQVLGTHNSFHIQPRPALFTLLVNFDAAFLAWEYTNIPLDQQFATEGIRQIELDVFADPEGGLYDQRRGLILIGE